MKGLGLLKSGMLLLSKHKSAILSGTAIVLAIGTVVETVRATFKASEHIVAAEDDKYEKVNENHEDSDFIPRDQVKLTVIETVKATWKDYIPAAIGLATTTVCIICAHKIDAKRIAAATSALVLSEKMNKELENKTIEEFGREKLDVIKQKIFHENSDLKKAYVDDNKALHKEVLRHDTCNAGYYKPSVYERMCWFKDEISGRYIWASKNQVERAINNTMREAIDSGCLVIQLNDWYDNLDIDQIMLGNILGWDLNRGQDLKVTYEADITDNGEPCLIMHYHHQPKLI